MNFRSTVFMFGLLLGMLWLFGLTVAYRKTAVDASYLVPTLQGNADVVIDSITIKRRVKDKPAEEFHFTKDNDTWSLKVPGVQKSVKLEAFRVNQIVNQVKDARRSDEAGVTDNLTLYGLDQPSTIVTLKGKALGKADREWSLYLGKESADQSLMYVNSSDRPTKVYGITKNSIDSVLFKDPNHLRARRLFEFNDTAVQTVAIKEGAVELDLKKGDDATWRFVKPAFGFADFEGPPAPKDLPTGARPPEGGVKGLLANIATIRVDSEEDFVPLSDAKLDTYGLEEGKEALRIEVDTVKGEKKEVGKEILAIGMAVKDKAQVFARMVGDQGVFKLNAKLLEPIKSALQKPGSLRSIDVLSLDTKKVDAVTVDQGKTKVTMLHPEGKLWEVKADTASLQKGNQAAIQALVDGLQGKREIVKFYDADDFKKLDAEMKTPTAVVALYVGGLTEEKKDTAKDKKEGADAKKEEKQDEPPHLKKDAKPAVTLTFGEANKETVNVQRELADGTTSRFVLPRAVLDKVLPGDLKLAFVDTSLPSVPVESIDRVVLARDKDKIDIEKGWGEQSGRWFFKEGNEPPGKNPADAAKSSLVVNTLVGLAAKKWLHKIDPKDDLDKLGLKKPSLEVTLYVKKVRAAAAASVVGLLATLSEWRGIGGEAAVLANRTLDPGDKVVLKVGKETDQEKDKPAQFAQRSDSDMLFLLPTDVVRIIRDADLRDRTSVVHAQPIVSATLVGLAAGPFNGVLPGSPLGTNLVQSFDATKVKELKLAIRTPGELRTLTFEADPQLKVKEWRDKSGLQEFTLDSQKVNHVLEQLATLKTTRWVNISGGTKAEQKLTAKEATLRVEVVLENGRSLTLTVGAPFEGLGYYAHTSALPDAVFLLGPGQVEAMQQGPAYFARERATE